MGKSWTLPSNEEFLKEFAPELLVDEEKRQKVRVRGAQPVVFNFILDISGSMEQYYHTLVDSFNSIMIPGLKGVQQNQLNTVLVGGILFSNKLIPLWPGFKPVKRLDEVPLRASRVKASGLHEQTALYAAMISGLHWTRLEMDRLEKENTGVYPRGKICVITDGINNLEPFDSVSVRQAMDQFAPFIRGKRKIQCVMLFVKTNKGMTTERAQSMAEAIDFEFSGHSYDLISQKVKDVTPRWTFYNALDAFYNKFQIWPGRQIGR